MRLLLSQQPQLFSPLRGPVLGPQVSGLQGGHSHFLCFIALILATVIEFIKLKTSGELSLAQVASHIINKWFVEHLSLPEKIQNYIKKCACMHAQTHTSNYKTNSFCFHRIFRIGQDFRNHQAKLCHFNLGIEKQRHMFQ